MNFEIIHRSTFNFANDTVLMKFNLYSFCLTFCIIISHVAGQLGDRLRRKGAFTKGITSLVTTAL